MHFFYYSLKIILDPDEPRLVARTDTTITVSVVKPTGNEQELIYKLKVVGDGSKNAKTSCNDISCTATDLKPGRPYVFSTQACIKADSNRCGAFSPTATIFAVPQSK